MTTVYDTILKKYGHLFDPITQSKKQGPLQP